VSINDLPTGEDQRSPFRRAGFLAALGFLVLVVLLAVAVVATHGSGKSKTPTAGGGPSTAAAQPSATSGSSTGNSCGLTDTSQTVPTTTPPNITWVLVHGDAVPTSPTAGPGKVQGMIASCYAHTPLGALIAASQIGDRLGIASNADAAEILKQQVVPGPGRDHDLAVLASGNNQNDGTVDGQTAAFQFVSYSPDTAVINLVSHMNNGTNNTATFTMRWLDGDWKLQLQDDGTDSSNVSQVSSLSGYVPWSGVS
jgi:hypothetical protein